MKSYARHSPATRAEVLPITTMYGVATGRACGRHALEGFAGVRWRPFTIISSEGSHQMGQAGGPAAGIRSDAGSQATDAATAHTTQRMDPLARP